MMQPLHRSERLTSILRNAWLLALVCLAGTATDITFAADSSEQASGPSAPSAEAAVDREQQLEFFESHVRPLLVERCYECHGPETAEPKGGLQFLSHESLLQGGDTGPAVVPGQASESLLIQSVKYEGPYEMPPKSRLSPEQIDILTRWVDAGAQWPQEHAKVARKAESFDWQTRKAAHWCWQSWQPVSLPVVAQSRWPQAPLDRFLLAKLEAEQMQPAPPAERHALIRRLYFDLIGLPPTPTEVANFVDDPRPDSVSHLIDRLLASPHFGERWARHWLDLVRYAETYGHEFDYAVPHAYEYRDYVIRALNADLPYDQFVREQIAGDLLESPRRHPIDGFNESIIGTGFWWLGEAIHAPTDVLQDEADRVDNQVDVVTKTFLGLTVACARCHDHKFDAISTEDYYSLAGYVRSMCRQRAALDMHDRRAHAAERLGQVQRRGTGLVRSAIQTDLTELAPRLTAYLLASRVAVSDGFSVKQENGQTTVAHPEAIDKAAQTAQLNAGTLRTVTESLLSAQTNREHPLHAWSFCVLAEQNAENDAPISFSERFGRWQKEVAEQIREQEKYEGQSELLADFRGGLPADWTINGEAFLPQGTEPGEWEPFSAHPRMLIPQVVHGGRRGGALQGTLRSPTFIIKQPQIHHRLAGRGILIRLYIDGHFMNEVHPLLFGDTYIDVNTDGRSIWRAQVGDINKYVGHRGHIEIVDRGDGYAAIEQIRFAPAGLGPPLAISPLSRRLMAEADIGSPAAMSAAIGRHVHSLCAGWPGGESAGEAHDVLQWAIDMGLFAANDTVKTALTECYAAVETEIATLPTLRMVLASADGTGLDHPIYVRGKPFAPGSLAPRRVPLALAGTDQPAVSGRGSGRLEFAERILHDAQVLVARVMVNRIWHQLFGRGLVPTVDNFGVLGETPSHPELLDHLAQQFVRDGWSIKGMIRHIVLSRAYQMSSRPHEADERDPQNRLWHRFSTRRVQGEVLRDTLLAISGRFDGRMHGPGVATHLTPFMEGRGRPAHNGPLDGAGRRSIYQEVRRNFLSPWMLAFDTPIPFSCVGRRSVSNVPAQSLILLNDPFVIQQSQQTVQRMRRGVADNGHRVTQIYELCLARAPTEAECLAAGQFLQEQTAAYQALGPAEITPELQAESDLCHMLFNVKEFLYVP